MRNRVQHLKPDTAPKKHKGLPRWVREAAAKAAMEDVFKLEYRKELNDIIYDVKAYAEGDEPCS